MTNIQYSIIKTSFSNFSVPFLNIYYRNTTACTVYIRTLRYKRYCKNIYIQCNQNGIYFTSCIFFIKPSFKYYNSNNDFPSILFNKKTSTIVIRGFCKLLLLQINMQLG